eukprot:EG_transcript_4683
MTDASEHPTRCSPCDRDSSLRTALFTTPDHESRLSAFSPWAGSAAAGSPEASLLETGQRLAQDNQRLLQRLRARDAECQQHSEELELCKAQIASLQRAICKVERDAQTQRTQRRIEEERQAMEDEISRLRLQVHQAEFRAWALQGQQRQTPGGSEAASGDVLAGATEATALQEERDQLLVEVSHLRSALEASHAEAEALAEAVATLTREAAQFQGQLGSLRAEKQQLQEQLLKAAEELTALCASGPDPSRGWEAQEGQWAARCAALVAERDAALRQLQVLNFQAQPQPGTPNGGDGLDLSQREAFLSSLEEAVHCQVARQLPGALQEVTRERDLLQSQLQELLVKNAELTAAAEEMRQATAQLLQRVAEAETETLLLREERQRLARSHQQEVQRLRQEARSDREPATAEPAAALLAEQLRRAEAEALELREELKQAHAQSEEAASGHGRAMAAQQEDFLRKLQAVTQQFEAKALATKSQPQLEEQLGRTTELNQRLTGYCQELQRQQAEALETERRLQQELEEVRGERGRLMECLRKADILQLKEGARGDSRLKAELEESRALWRKSEEQAEALRQQWTGTQQALVKAQEQTAAWQERTVAAEQELGALQDRLQSSQDQLQWLKELVHQFMAGVEGHPPDARAMAGVAHGLAQALGTLPPPSPLALAAAGDTSLASLLRTPKSGGGDLDPLRLSMLRSSAAA